MRLPFLSVGAGGAIGFLGTATGRSAEPIEMEARPERARAGAVRCVCSAQAATHDEDRKPSRGTLGDLQENDSQPVG